jgi:hypothetical protein
MASRRVVNHACHLSIGTQVESDAAPAVRERHQEVVCRELDAMESRSRTTLDVEHHVLPRNRADPVGGAGKVELGVVVRLFHRGPPWRNSPRPHLKTPEVAAPRAAERRSKILACVPLCTRMVHGRATRRRLWRVPHRGRPEEARLLNTLGDRENDTAVEGVLVCVGIETEIG